MNRWHKLALDIASLWVITWALLWLGIALLCIAFVVYVVVVVVFQ